MLADFSRKNDLRQSVPKLDQLKSEFENVDESEVWDRFRMGGESALIFIYNKYFNTLFRYGSQFTYDKSLIKDAIQEVFMELIQKQKKISPTTSVKFYLFKSLKRTLINLIKKDQKYDYKDNFDGFEFLITSSAEHVVINSQLNEEKMQKISLAMKELSKKQREVLYYFYFENLSISEISALMNNSNNKSTQNLLYRSLQMLKSSLALAWVVFNVELVNILSKIQAVY